jgi:hypothetical protein
MEYQDFHKRWDDALDQIEQQDKEALRAFEERHIREREEYRQMLEQKFLFTFKPSVELFNLNYMSERLIS